MSGGFDNEAAIDCIAQDAASGDDKAMARLIEIIMPAAKAKAASLNSSDFRISTEDLVQEGMIGFLDAVKRFDRSRGVPFRAYACNCIENRIISALRRNSNSGNAALSGAVSIEGADLGSEQSDPAALAESSDEMARLSVIVENEFSGFERQVFFRKLRGDSYREIAESLGCNEKSVDNAIQRIRRKIKNSD